MDAQLGSSSYTQGEHHNTGALLQQDPRGWTSHNGDLSAIHGAHRPSPADNTTIFARDGRVIERPGSKRPASGNGETIVLDTSDVISVQEVPPPPKSRKVHTPGATQAALQRLAALKEAAAEESGPSHSDSAPLSTLPTSGATPPSGRKVPTPGATQAAVARLASLGAGVGASTTTTDLPTASAKKKGGMKAKSSTKQLPGVASGGGVPPRSGGGGGGGSRKVAAPGATQVALARLAALQNGAHRPKEKECIMAYHNASHGPATNDPLRAPASHAQSFIPPNNVSSDFGDYAPGTVVWAKMQSYPWWPAQIQRPSPDHERLNHDFTRDVFVVFYGTSDYTWIPKADVKLLDAGTAHYAKFASTKNKALQKAIDEAWVYLGRARPDVLGKLV